jgi:predicted nucleotidyltransferase
MSVVGSGATHPQRGIAGVIPFGSAATGTVTKDSDLDLPIVEPSPEKTRQESVKIRRALGDVGHPIALRSLSRVLWKPRNLIAQWVDKAESDFEPAQRSRGSSFSWRRANRR